MDVLDAVRRKAWESRFYHPPTLAKPVPTMLSPEECNMLSWLGEYYFQGDGAVVELGCFLGGSTVRLASGLARSGRRWQLHSYDRFTIDEKRKERYLYREGYPRFEGEDMFPIFRQHVQAFGDHVKPHRGNVEDHPWTGGPIEILFVDIAKTLQTHNFVLEAFFKHLAPGRSLIVQQDYLHHQTPWLIATMEMLHPKVEMVSWTRNNSVLFLCREPITDSDLERVRYDRLAPSEIETLFLAARARFPFEWQREMVAQALDTYRESPDEHRGYLLQANNETSPSLGPYAEPRAADRPPARAAPAARPETKEPPRPGLTGRFGGLLRR